MKPEVLEYSRKISEVITTDSSGVVTGDTQKVYDENLPEGITPDTVKTLAKYDKTVVLGTTHAVGQLAIETMKKHPELNKVTGEFPFGYNAKTSVAVDRRRETVNNFSPDKSVIVKHGAVRVDVHYASGDSGASFTEVKNEIAAIGLKELAGG